MNDDPLKYRFVAEYMDGTLFEQNAADVSAVDEKRSAFFDVDHDRLRTFSLWSADHCWLVDLRDGHFEIDNVRFNLCPPGEAVWPLHLVFFRKHQHSIVTGYEVNAALQWEKQDTRETNHSIVFRLGWAAITPAGAPIERVMEFE